MSEDLIREMFGDHPPDPDDPVALYFDQRRTTGVYVLTRWWVAGRAVPLLFALADRKQPTDEPLLPAEARQILAENIYYLLAQAQQDYGWNWRGDESDPLYTSTVELAMTFWPDEACQLEWVDDEVLREAEARQHTIIAKWKQACGV